MNYIGRSLLIIYLILTSYTQLFSMELSVKDIEKGPTVREKRLSSKYENERDLARLALCFQLSALDNGLGKEIEHNVRRKLNKLRLSDNEVIALRIRQLEDLKSKVDLSNIKDIQSSVLNNEELHAYINDIVKESLEEYDAAQNKKIDKYKRKSTQKEKQKWVAIGVAAFTSLSTIITGLVVNYTT